VRGEGCHDKLVIKGAWGGGAVVTNLTDKLHLKLLLFYLQILRVQNAKRSKMLKETLTDDVFLFIIQVSPTKPVTP
jgi:hypothetical protein